MKYIKNETRYDIFIKTRDLNIVLRTRTVSKETGSVLATGYTPVEDEDYTKLKELPDYARFLKSGRLSEYGAESLPEDALSESDIISSLQAKITDLEEEVEKLREENGILKGLVAEDASEEASKEATDEEETDGTGKVVPKAVRKKKGNS